ncbi:hypothetical protein E2C01_047571 [Portunus trituberculatus]|uniref:Uncharacterized protein n=1 Tax=Portunus trituberculatus TaxID=210409 RepID=A0A5B7G8X3_PORTR|nr:hypothetical protein [Portunus trituberculatus]
MAIDGRPYSVFCAARSFSDPYPLKPSLFIQTPQHATPTESAPKLSSSYFSFSYLHLLTTKRATYQSSSRRAKWRGRRVAFEVHHEEEEEEGEKEEEEEKRGRVEGRKKVQNERLRW